MKDVLFKITLLFGVLAALQKVKCTNNVSGACGGTPIQMGFLVSEKLSASDTEADKYIKRFEIVAKMEAERFGIPASISLAQGLLESGNGTSVLARKYNNHFGIKCKVKKCKNPLHSGHVWRHDGKDGRSRFATYETAWNSWRDHSLFLAERNRKRYARCFTSNSAWHWAKMLKICGYATSDTYTEKLNEQINTHRLRQFD